MRLEHLCDFSLEYDALGVALVRPYAGHEGQGFGTGTGRVTGERLSGDVRWANYPRMADDGVFLPDVRGVIATHAGPVLFEFRGHSVPVAPGSVRRAVTAAVAFRAGDDDHRWLNHVVAVHEGFIDFTTMTMSFPTFVCVADVG